MEYDKRIEIRYLLDLYFEGETTLEQERRLREYFSGDDVPADLEYARSMFGFFSSAAGDRMKREVCLPADEVTDTDTEDLEDEVSGNTVLPESEAAPVGKKPLNRNLRLLYRVVSVAAMVLLAIGVTFTVSKHAGRTEIYCYVDGQPVTDPDIALRQAEMAARLLEGGFKASVDGLATAGDAGRALRSISDALQGLQEASDDVE